MVCYGQDEMACHLHLILCTWDAVTTCTPVTVFFPLGVQLCLEKMRVGVCTEEVLEWFNYPRASTPHGCEVSY